jgi:hypothetical protein
MVLPKSLRSLKKGRKATFATDSRKLALARKQRCDREGFTIFREGAWSGCDVVRSSGSFPLILKNGRFYEFCGQKLKVRMRGLNYYFENISHWRGRYDHIAQRGFL